MLIIDSPEYLAERCSVHLTVKKIHCNSLNQGRDHKSTVWECLILKRELNDESFGRRALVFKNQSYPGSTLCHWVKNKQLVCHIPPSVLLYYFWNGMKVTDYNYCIRILGGSKITTDVDCSHKIKRHLLLGRKSMTNLDSILKSRHYLANKGPSSQSCGFSSGHVWMGELDHKESWAPKNRCFWTVVLEEKTLESLLDCKEIKPVHPKGDQSWIFIGRTDAEAEAPILWPPDMKNWFIGKDPNAGKDWGQEEKEMTKDEIVGWHHWLNEHEFEQALGVDDG